MYWKQSPGLKQTTYGFSSTPRYSFIVITPLSCQSKSSILGMMNERKSQKWNEGTGSCRIFQRKCPVAKKSHRQIVPSLKRSIAETVHRRNGPSPKRLSPKRLSPKRSIAETVIAKTSIAETASPKRHRRNGIAETSQTDVHHMHVPNCRNNEILQGRWKNWIQLSSRVFNPIKSEEKYHA